MSVKNPIFGKFAEGKYKLQVLLDASGVQDFKPERELKVAVYNAAGRFSEQTVKFERNGGARATFTFGERPGNLRVVIGPGNATLEQLRGLQTLAVEVPARMWAGKDQLELGPIIISNYYWRWWWAWCRNFKITGKVVCANGDPVPGAQVCAYDVDWWWWWWSKDLLGCATTDIHGAFEIDFTHCCGWWPWWWWEQRIWRLNPELVNRLMGVLRQDPRFTKIPIPSPHPDPQIFESLLGSLTGDPTQLMQPAGARQSRSQSRGAFDPTTLDSLRTDLLKTLPPAPEFEHLRLWPWWPWRPWWDCDVDVVFEVTQNCQGANQVIVDESVWDAHQDIPTNFNITLTANQLACCAAHCMEDCPDGNCLLPTDICGENVGSIGGNYGAIAASPVGLLNPGEGLSINYAADRPYSGSVPIYGAWGSQTNIDYYELMVYYAGDGTPPPPLKNQYPVIPPSPLPVPPIASSAYSALSVPAFGGFSRTHLVFTPLPNWPSVLFNVQSLSDGTQMHNVVETIAHYEAVNGPQLWDSGTFNLLFVLNSLNNLPNGTYYLQVQGWERPGTTGNLKNPQILPICGTEDFDTPVPNYWVLTIDNQVATVGPFDPDGLPCGVGTVHLCTGQPETEILQVQILHNDGTVTTVGACGNICIVDTDQLQIDFVAYDPDAYLAYYDLQLVYGSSLLKDLLTLPGATLSASTIPPVYAPAAAQVGPNYLSALSAPQNASAPWWSGGAIRLVVNAAAAFPETCAYDLQLIAHKRTIGGGGQGGCDGGYWNQYNISELSFTIVNPCPPASPCPPTAAASVG